MNPRLISLVFAPFAFGTSAFAFVGLIDPMADGLGVGISMIGQLQTVFALACGIGGPILARALGGADRKKLLISIMLILGLVNLISAVSPNYTIIAGVRIAGGLIAALTLPVASTIAVSLVPEIKRPSALATVLAGYTLAFLVGMPLSTLLGELFGWRAAFWFAAAIAVSAALIILAGAPQKVSVPEIGDIGFSAALRGDNPLLMGVSLLAFTATFISVSYVGPVITAFSGVTGAGIGGVQIATGVGSLIGLPAGALLARLPIRTALVGLLFITLSTQLVFSLGMINSFGAFALPILVVSMALGSAALFATSPVIQTQLAQTAGPAATLAFALNGSMIYFGQGLGAAFGGWITSAAGLAWVGIGGVAAAVSALVVISLLSRQSTVASPVVQSKTNAS